MELTAVNEQQSTGDRRHDKCSLPFCPPVLSLGEGCKSFSVLSTHDALCCRDSHVADCCFIYLFSLMLKSHSLLSVKQLCPQSGLKNSAPEPE